MGGVVREVDEVLVEQRQQTRGPSTAKVGIIRAKGDSGKAEKVDLSKKYRGLVPLDREDLSALFVFLVTMLLIITFAATLGLAVKVFFIVSGGSVPWAQ
jgi:hypothetical protein